MSAFAFLGGSPQSILYDNTKLAVARILGDGRRQRTRAFTELQSHYLFEDRFGRPSKGNEKGKVEGMVGYARRNFLVPLPRVDDFTEPNTYLERRCLARMDVVLRGHAETIGQRMERDLEDLLPLPSAPCEPCNSRPPGQFPVPGPPPYQWLPGAGGLWTPGDAGQSGGENSIATGNSGAGKTHQRPGPDRTVPVRRHVPLPAHCGSCSSWRVLSGDQLSPETGIRAR